MPSYRIPSAQDRSPLQRRASGMALALGVNLLLLLVLLGLGVIRPPEKNPSQALVVDFIPESHNAAAQASRSKPKPRTTAETKPVAKPPPIVIPAKPTIRQPDKPLDMIEMSKDELAAADLRNVPKASAGDSEEVGSGPHGEVLYAAEWSREPTSAEISGYWPAKAPSGWGMVACKTIPGNRVDDCVEIDQSPHGSHLASAVRQMAWQFHVRPPRKNGRAMVGSWVRILIEIEKREE